MLGTIYLVNHIYKGEKKEKTSSKTKNNLKIQGCVKREHYCML